MFSSHNSRICVRGKICLQIRAYFFGYIRKLRRKNQKLLTICKSPDVVHFRYGRQRLFGSKNAAFYRDISQLIFYITKKISLHGAKRFSQHWVSTSNPNLPLTSLSIPYHCRMVRLSSLYKAQCAMSGRLAGRTIVKSTEHIV